MTCGNALASVAFGGPRHPFIVLFVCVFVLQVAPEEETPKDATKISVSVTLSRSLFITRSGNNPFLLNICQLWCDSRVDIVFEYLSFSLLEFLASTRKKNQRKKINE